MELKNMDKQMNLAHYFRHLWEEPGLMVIVGNSEEIIKGHTAYNAHYKISQTEKNNTEKLNLMFAAAGLVAVSLPERESWGWSLSLPGSTTGLFCAMEPEGMISGRIIQTEMDKNTAVVQRQKPGSEITQSNFSLKSSSPVKAAEQYFEESEQNLVRIAVNQKGAGVLIHALPGGNFGKSNSLSDDDLIALCIRMSQNDEIKKLEEVLLFYECRCTDEMILNMITSLPEKQRKELWADQGKLGIECPRCSRNFTLHKKQ
jgi:hypothetical protein